MVVVSESELEPEGWNMSLCRPRRAFAGVLLCEAAPLPSHRLLGRGPFGPHHLVFAVDAIELHALVSRQLAVVAEVGSHCREQGA